MNTAHYLAMRNVVGLIISESVIAPFLFNFSGGIFF